MSLVACSDGEANPPAPAACRVSRAVSAATVADRHLLGAAQGYPADRQLAQAEATLLASQRARRAAAWDAVRRVVEPVAVPGRAGRQGTLPRFRTWYDREDLTRVFQALYEQLSPAARSAHATFDEALLDQAFSREPQRVEGLPLWDAARWQRYLDTFDDPARWVGLGGMRRMAVSPAAARHLVQSYPAVLRCLAEGSPPALAGAPEAPTTQHETITLEPCTRALRGPFALAAGGTLVSAVDPAPGLRMRVLEGVNAALASTRCEHPSRCERTGPGVFWVELESADAAVSTHATVQFQRPSGAGPGCLNGAFPPEAATVAIEWRRADAGDPFVAYDTDAAALARRLAPNADATWGAGDRRVNPADGDTLTVENEGGARYRLAAMHLRTRELSQWLNITLWYSDRPNEDFGADRPAALSSTVWSHYKMCVAIDYQENDPEPDGGYDRDLPSLGAALRAVNEGRGAASWCSNPYIDAGPGLVRSNCVGCHQHAMTGVRPGDTVADAVLYPDHGRQRVRDNSPADMFWGLDGGDDYATIFTETVAHWAAASR